MCPDKGRHRRPQRLCICGGGNGAHVLAPLAAGDPDWDVWIYAPFGDEADRLTEGIGRHGGLTVDTPSGPVSGAPHGVDRRAKVAAAGAGLVALVAPAFAHGDLLSAVAPHIRGNAWVGALPARGGFEFQAPALLSGKPDVTLFGLQTLPWACRIGTYGESARVLGIKDRVGVAAWPAQRAPAVAARLRRLLGLMVYPMHSMLELTLANVGQIIHPGIFYGLLHDAGDPHWAAEDVPLFYQGLTPAVADLLAEMSAEVQCLRRALEQEFRSRVRLDHVLTLKEWLLDTYSTTVADGTTLAQAFRTNSAYAGLRMPVRSGPDGEWLPDYGSRYLTEDVPYGLVVTRAIAGLAGVRTPVIDEVIIGTSRWTGAEYLVDNELIGRDIARTRVPSLYGIQDLDSLVQAVVGGATRPAVSS